MPKGKDFTQAYNAQAGVDTGSMLIVGHRVTQHSNDKLELEPMLVELAKLSQGVGPVNHLLADAGYFSEINVRACVQAGVEPYIVSERHRHNSSAFSRFEEPSCSCPDVMSDPVGNMRHRLRTKAGKALYALRKSTVEPVFGILKAVLGFRQFSFRGKELVSSEWGIVCTAWNMKRLHRLFQTI
jgi:hypothetical protein